MAGNIPQTVLDQVRSALARARNIAERLQQCRGLDDQFQGNGRYESEVFERLSEEMSQPMKTIGLFRELAPKNGVDAEQVIAELGGLAELRLSERAVKYGAR